MPLPRSLLSVLSPKTALAATTAGEKMPNFALLPICRADLESVRPRGGGAWGVKGRCVVLPQGPMVVAAKRRPGTSQWWWKPSGDG